MATVPAPDPLEWKIAYVGPGLAGKSTNLRYAFERTPHERRTELVSEATSTSRWLSLRLTPATLPAIGGRAIRLLLCAVPGTVLYDESRERLFEAVDGLVCVADSQRSRMEANVESVASLEAELGARGRALADVPLVLQYNKRDLADRSEVSALERVLNPTGRRYVEATALTGAGVFETLRVCAQLLRERVEQLR